MEEDKGPKVKFYNPNLNPWTPNMFEKAYMEKTGQISLKNIQADKTYESHHILVHVISRPWGGASKVSIKVEDIRDPMQRIMFYWPRNPCPDLKTMKPNWIYRVTNFKGCKYEKSIVSGGIQIELHANSRIEPMPTNLDIRLCFKSMIGSNGYFGYEMGCCISANSWMFTYLTLDRFKLILLK